MDEEAKKKYNEYVESVTPTHNLWSQMAKAFLTGGAICALGQGIKNLIICFFELDSKTASTWVSVVLVFLSVVLTATGIYPRITKFGGAGSLVPITGFANSVAAPAIEFKKEGQTYGTGAKIFTIAGPVILYGIFSSTLIGFIYWLIILFKG